MTSIRLLKNGVEAFPVMFSAIDRAVSSVALEMYIVKDDETGRAFREHLLNALKRNLKVMVLVDSWGSWNLPGNFWDGLREAGGTIRWFHPLLKGLFPFRNHRKLLLLDDSIAYIGGINIADEYYHGSKGEKPWRDNVLEIAGPEAARLRRSFSRMWTRDEMPFRRLLHRLRRARRMRAIANGRVQFLESGPENPMRQVRRAYRQVIQNAQKDIDLAMGYFYPHGRMIRSLKRAVRRGARVRLLVPLHTDIPITRWAARGLYGRLLRAGVEVWEYLPCMMHSKLAIADDTVIAGSANLDIRSGRFNYELVAVVRDPTLAARVRSDFEEDLKQSQPIHFEEWNRRPFIQKIKERFSYFLLARTDVFIARLEMARKMR